MIVRSRIVLRLILPGLVAVSPVMAQQTAPARRSTTVSSQSSRIATARKYLRDVLAKERIPGISAAVAIDGRIVWAEGFGFADLENKVPLTMTSRMRIASISKSLTAAAVGQLVEQGKLDLDAPVQTYVPSFPAKPWPITTRQLAGHLAGIRHYRQGEFESMRAYPGVVPALAIFKDDTLRARPGTRYLYSTYGFNLVSASVEGASGEPFLTYMQRHVFAPLGMTRTTGEFVDSLIPERSRYYLRDSAGPIVNAPYVDNSNKWAGGGFLSTPSDLVTFGSAFLKPGFLKSETIALLWKSQQTSDGKPTGYAIGFRTAVDSAGRRIVSHSGGAMAANSLLLIYPAEKLVVAVITNTNTRYASAGAREIARIFLAR
jgi:serine beta-lactamase-like protein LACTB